MPRQRKSNPDGFFDIFPTRLRELVHQNHVTQQTVATAVGKSRQTISYYQDGTVSPDWKTIVNLADFFGVSTDYLLGLSDVSSSSIEVQAVCDFTGLSEKSIIYLHRLENNLIYPPHSERLSILDYLLSMREFDDFLTQIEKYVSLRSEKTNSEFLFSSEGTHCADKLKENGFLITAPGVKASSIFHDKITVLLKMMLDRTASLLRGDPSETEQFDKILQSLAFLGKNHGDDQAD